MIHIDFTTGSNVESRSCAGLGADSIVTTIAGDFILSLEAFYAAWGVADTQVLIRV